MKKIILSLVMALVLIVATSCSLQSGDTIKFTSLPQPVYTQGYSEEAFKKEVKVSINGYETSLDSAEGVVIAGLDFQTVGSHTLVVVYNSASLTFDYEVVASLTTTKVADETQLREAIVAQVSVIELTANIESNDKFEFTYPVTIYGNGHKISVKGSVDRCVNVNGVNNAKVAFYDLNVELESTASNSRGINLAKCVNVELIIDNCSVYNKNYYAINITGSNDNIVVNVKNGSTAGGYCAINWWASNSELNVFDSELKGENIHRLAKGNDFAVVVISSDSATNGKNNILNLSNVTLTATSEKGNNEYIAVIQDFGNKADNNVINFNKCTFNQAVINNELCAKWFMYNATSSIVVDGEKVA